MLSPHRLMVKVDEFLGFKSVSVFVKSRLWLAAGLTYGYILIPTIQPSTSSSRSQRTTSTSSSTRDHHHQRPRYTGRRPGVSSRYYRGPPPAGPNGDDPWFWDRYYGKHSRDHDPYRTYHGELSNGTYNGGDEQAH